MLHSLVAALLLTPADVTVTFVRHAETVANATGVYNSKTLNVFSELGKSQVRALTERLAPQRFDRIYVSPSPRALRTIEPYLRRTGQTAVVDPLLYECCTGKRPSGAKATWFRFGGVAALPEGTADVFRFEAGRDKLPVAPDFGSGLAQVEACVAAFWARNPGGSVLVVGHSGHGGEFVFRLTGKRLRVENAKEIVFGARRPAP